MASGHHMKRTRNSLHAFFCATLFASFAFADPALATLVTFDFENLSGDVNGALVSNGFVLDPGQVDWAPDAQGWIGHYHIAEPTQNFWTANNGTKFMVVDYIS